MKQGQKRQSRRPKKPTGARRKSRWFDIPRFLDRKVINALAEERGVSVMEATTLVFAEDHYGTPMPRVRRRAGA